MTPKLVTSGRTDVDDYFQLSGIREYTDLRHTPFLVFAEKGNVIEVQIVRSATQLLDYPDHTKAMGQWKGKWRSDFFQFTVGQFRTFITEHPPTRGQIV